MAWCLYDFANSAYTTLIITVAFSVYFREAVVNAPDNTGDRLWGLANFAAMLVVAVISPFVGALADCSGRRKTLLILATLQAVLATALLATVEPGRIAWAMILYVVGTVGFEVGYVFYNAFLPDIAPTGAAGRISGWAWAVGYAGGLAALAVCYPFIGTDLRDESGALVASAVADRRISFLLVSLFFLIFALPAFLWLPGSRAQGRPGSLTGYVRQGFDRVRQTLKHVRAYPETGKFIVASVFFNDGITTIIAFSAIYATSTFGFSSAEVRMLFIVLNVVAFPGAVVAGYLADAVGPRRTLLMSLGLWIVVVALACTATGRLGFWIMASGAAIGMGSTQAVGRSFMALISPPEREAEFFGFYVLAGKFASMFGPLVFGLVSSATGSQRLAVLSLLPFFVIGWILTARIDEGRAYREATGRHGT